MRSKLTFIPAVRFGARARRTLRSKRGSVAIQIGLMMIIILGMVGLGVEITFVLYKQRQMQSAADSAAFGGATALMRGYPADFRIESRAVAAAVGFVNGVDGVAVTVNRPPTLGPQAGNNDAVEVIVSQPQHLGLVSLFREGLFQVGARAVATLGGTGTSCILQSLPNWMTGISLSNGVRVELDECGMDANATGPSSLSVTGGARLTTQYVSVSGEVSVNNGAANRRHRRHQDQPARGRRPLCQRGAAAYSGCDHNKMTIGGAPTNKPFSPGSIAKGSPSATAPGSP